jgi:hypothetical protein
MPIFNAYPSKRGIVKPADYSTGRTVLDSSTNKWKADKDCWITFYLTGTTSSPKEVYINGKLAARAYTGADVDCKRPGIYINKGDVVETKGSSVFVEAFNCR